MKSKRVKAMVVVGLLIGVTGIAMASLNRRNTSHQGNISHIEQPRRAVHDPQVGALLNQSFRSPGEIVAEGSGPLSVSAQLVQDKFLARGNGEVRLWLTLRGDEVAMSEEQERQSVDMVIVLDQSGSMEGQKIEYARMAVLDLLDRLSPQDRFALVGYADSVWKYADLDNVNDRNRKRFQSLVTSISSGGGTNLGDGLQEGISMLLARRQLGNQGKLILISDGLANQGITGHDALGNVASIAVEKEFAISTVGVGDDFNEQLMTIIADRGVGNYYYLDNLQAFAEVFHQEFYQSATAAAHAIEITIPLPEGVSLIEASGYPITIRENQAVVHYGDLGSGQTRRLFLTFRFPTRSETTYSLQGLNFTYSHQGEPHTAGFPGAFQVACVNDQQEVFASMHAVGQALGSYQVDNNIFATRIAEELKKGDQSKALQTIAEYEAKSRALFDQLAAQGMMTEEVEHVREADQKEITEWREIVADTFTGSAQEIERKRKTSSKFLQFRSYKEQREK